MNRWGMALAGLATVVLAMSAHEAHANFRRLPASTCNTVGRGDLRMIQDGCTGNADWLGARCVSPTRDVYVNRNGGQVIFSCPLISDRPFPVSSADFLGVSVAGDVWLAACVQPLSGGDATCGAPTHNTSGSFMTQWLDLSAVRADHDNNTSFVAVTAQPNAEIAGYLYLDKVN
jgi:hypothetical protein